ncbi:MAG: phosphate acyltransferase PlsX [Chlamydiales bacterium]|nr:phosphate acyltransferase PlsX [Chlamydiales bacterium]
MSKKSFRIGVDLMGSEKAPELFFDAVAATTRELDEQETLVVYGTPEVLAELQARSHKLNLKGDRLHLEPCEEVIEMDDSPLTAIRHKKNSTMMTGMRQLRDAEVDAFVSAGNTGALIASGTIMLPMLPGVERPALLAMLPTRRGFVAVVDVGGNVSCKPQHLVQFAKMGAAYLRSYGLKHTPSVGLLNIGEESKKGTPEARQAYEMLEEACHADSGMTFAGNIEGREVFQGKVDVLVTDGFTGNIFLKTSEGVSFFILGYLQDAFNENPDPRLEQVIRTLHGIVDYDEYPGAIVSGVDRILIKCHGSSSSRAMSKALLGARNLLRGEWLTALRQQLPG